MQKVSKHTQSKVIGGYILLFLLSILSTILIYKQITKLIVNEETDSNANRKLFIIGNTITGLYEAEALSNAFIQTGSRGYFQKYKAIMDETESNIDSLRNWTTRLDQLLRIDTITSLLENKVRNLQDLVHVKSSFAPEDFYNKAIASISYQDSIQDALNIRKRYVTTYDSSYIKTEKKKKFWPFSKAQQDSVLQVTTSHHVIVDTLNTSLRNTDTVVNILRSTWEDVQKQTQSFVQQINRKEYALIRQSTEITDQLKRILGEYEKEEITHASQKQTMREQTITTMIRIFAWVAVAAFLLVIFFTFFISRDLSRSQRYRRELESANKYADELLKSREKMILTVTHDIKSPLSSVIGYIELLINTPINERQRYFLKNMQGSSEHILKLVSNLLDLSKLENHKMPVEEIVFKPAQLFQEITDTFLPQAATKQLELTGKFGEDLSQDWKGDALRIRQIVTNILSNAVKYTNKGSIRFTARSTTDDKRLIITIEDTGTGMTMEEQKLIFQEFTRLKSHSGIEGTGLGLTITLKLIHLLGGEMTLQSKPGKGSCFRISLPLQKVKAAVPVLPEVTGTTPAPVTSPMAPLHILLVDDDPLQLAMTAGLLENHGLYAHTTTHPQEVVRQLQAEHYDMVFSDIQMPEMNGFDLVRQIRRLPVDFAQTIPVIALSADADKKEEDYVKAGFSAYLSKPFTSQQLIDVICQFTGMQPEAPKPALTTDMQATEGYTLKNILQFADNDEEALTSIIQSFLKTTREHLVLLKEYQQSKQWLSIAQLAHKMLPMFRQLETKEIVSALEQLEHSAKEPLQEKEITRLTQEVIKKAGELLKALE